MLSEIRFFIENQNIIASLLHKYDIQSVDDIQDALKDFLGGKEIEDWQHHPLSRIYPVIFIDAIHFSVRDNNIWSICYSRH